MIFASADVRQRANHLCEYCHADEHWQWDRFFIDHVFPKSRGPKAAGGAGYALQNLALACRHCNRRKSDKLFAIDPATGQLAPLFNPREQQWAEHFTWTADGLRIVPLTATGRATAALLDFNRARALRIRAADVAVKRHPPADDPTQTTES
ncbi:MAG: HNH endonuclease [Acidobacteria bacterium]|nr:HNH endonuclease [Acidobacteriota bacterium]MBI3426543.1 HNH endonuclease [Acidobacteriota bacterium]